MIAGTPELTTEYETADGPRIRFACGHTIWVSERNALDPYRCPKCSEQRTACPTCGTPWMVVEAIRDAVTAERVRCAALARAWKPDPLLDDEGNAGDLADLIDQGPV